MNVVILVFKKMGLPYRTITVLILGTLGMECPTGLAKGPEGSTYLLLIFLKMGWGL